MILDTSQQFNSGVYVVGGLIRLLDTCCVADYKCIDSIVQNSYVYYVRQIGTSFVCVQAAAAGEIMLERTQDLGEHMRCR